MPTLAQSATVVADARCRSSARRLVVLLRDLPLHAPQLLEALPRLGWSYDSKLGALTLGVADRGLPASVKELAAFIRAAVQPQVYDAIRAAWVHASAPLSEQMGQLQAAEPLANFVQTDDPVLMDVLDARRLETWYQPIIHVATREVWGYECLIRGRTHYGAPVSPAALIEWARRNHVVYLLDSACREANVRNAGQAGIGAQQCICINFLPASIYSPETCLKRCAEAVAQSGLKPEQVVFEVVETDQVSDRDHLKRIVDYCRAQRFRIAIDDVHSGYAGLALVAQLEPDVIKIDRRVIGLAESAHGMRNVCRSLVRLGKDHGKLVLAEGIETSTQLAMMASLGVDLAQGYYIGRPSPTPQETTLPPEVQQRT